MGSEFELQRQGTRREEGSVKRFVKGMRTQRTQNRFAETRASSRAAFPKHGTPVKSKLLICLVWMSTRSAVFEELYQLHVLQEYDRTDIILNEITSTHF